MVDKTLEALIEDIQDAIYQAAGIGTQVYSETTLTKLITDAFIYLATDPEKNWKRFNTYVTYTLDGTTGRTTALISATFADHDAIKSIFRGNTEVRLTQLDLNNNPAQYSGDTVLGYVHDTTDIIKFVPATADGTVTVVGRAIPTEFDLNDTVPFDYLAIKYFVAWKYSVDDGANNASSEKFRQLFEDRYDKLTKSQDQAPIALNGLGQMDYPREWFVR